MPRRKAASKREMLPDPVYGSEKLSRFINVVMRRGKRSVAERIVYTALEEASGRLHKKAGRPAGKPGHGHEKDESSGEGNGTSTRSGSGQLSPRDVLGVLDKALDNIRPSVEVKPRRVGGATYQVPVEVSVERGIALAMRWIVKSAKARSERSMIHRLSAEMIEAVEGRGASVKMRDDMHRMARANQAFAHYRW